MIYISVNFKDSKNADHILKSLEDIQSLYDTLFVILSNIRNQRRFSSRLSIPMFIGTPCTWHLYKDDFWSKNLIRQQNLSKLS